jgi:hypothetical protein
MMQKLAITVLQLLSDTPAEIIKRSKDYDPVLVRHSKDRWVYDVGDKIVRIKLVKVPLQRVTREQLLALSKLKNRDILVSCNCGFWKWNGPDYHANNQGYSERSFSDLSEPTERDPQSKFLICKHVCAALKQFKNDFKTISLD